MRILILALVFAVLAVPAAFAHPPSLVDISLTDTGKVQVMVRSEERRVGKECSDPCR
jgi:hypothetical protein